MRFVIRPLEFVGNFLRSSRSHLPTSRHRQCRMLSRVVSCDPSSNVPRKRLTCTPPVGFSSLQNRPNSRSKHPDIRRQSAIAIAPSPNATSSTGERLRCLRRLLRTGRRHPRRPRLPTPTPATGSRSCRPPATPPMSWVSTTTITSSPTPRRPCSMLPPKLWPSIMAASLGARRTSLTWTRP